jgi:hypothetical protein
VTLRPTTGLGLPELSTAEPLTHVVAATLRKRRGPATAGARGHAHWAPAFFGLDRVACFAAASPAARAAIVERCGQELLAEAFYIEKAGMAFAAKMVLLAQSTDERKLYALFAGDEAAHFDAIAPFYRARLETPTDHPFLALLSQLIEDGDRKSLQLVIQVVLEGWGLSHYRVLRDGCSDPGLAGVFGAILADEAAHHGSGVVLLADARLPPASQERVVAVLRRFLGLVQAGPLMVVGAVESVLGPLPAAERRRLFAELDAERHAAVRLDQLRQLLGKSAAAGPTVAELERAGCFQPLVSTSTSGELA